MWQHLASTRQSNALGLARDRAHEQELRATTASIYTEAGVTVEAHIHAAAHMHVAAEATTTTGI